MAIAAGRRSKRLKRLLEHDGTMRIWRVIISARFKVISVDQDEAYPPGQNVVICNMYSIIVISPFDISKTRDNNKIELCRDTM